MEVYQDRGHVGPASGLGCQAGFEDYLNFLSYRRAQISHAMQQSILNCRISLRRLDRVEYLRRVSV
jgi:hypothetical protein